MTEPDYSETIVAAVEAAAVYRRPDRRVALVTGAGAGAGAAIAFAFAEAGLRVVVSDIDYALAGTVAADIRTRGGQALAHRCDVASEDQVIGLIERAQRDFGALTCVVNNAGPFLADDPLDHWHRVVSANLLGTLLVTRHAIAAMQGRGGSIVNVAACSGLGFGAAEQPAYAAAKAGIMRFTAAMAFAHTDHGVRVNCVAPDWIATDHRLAWADALEPVQKAALGVPEVMNSPEMLARLVVDLSHRSDYAGRVMVCRSGQPPQLLPYGDSGFSGLESFHDH